MKHFSLLLFLSLALIGLTQQACKHDSSVITPPDPPGGGGGGGGNTGGGTGTGVPCDPDSVYFANQVLPILVSNCAKSGCHDAASHEEGIILTSYQSLISTVEKVKLNNQNENELLKVILDNDPDDRMPPAPEAPLTADQINLLKKWVAQGAQNNACNANYGGCDITSVGYAAVIQPLMQNQCLGCHGGNATSGGGIKLGTYADVRTQALNGNLYNSISRSTNWMPKGGAKLDACAISQVKAWVDAGAPNN